MEETKGKIVRLRPLSQVREERIHQNLQPLVYNNKKKVAQKYFYEQGQSPILRKNVEYKAPVHSRLGGNVKPRVSILGTNTNSLMPRPRRHFNFQQTRPHFSVQNRLQRIRNTNNSIQRRKFQRYIPQLQIQVNNPRSGFHNPAHSGFHNPTYRFQMILNPVVQREINILQMQAEADGRHALIEGLKFITPVTTSCTLNLRFSNLN